MTIVQGDSSGKNISVVRAVNHSDGAGVVGRGGPATRLRAAMLIASTAAAAAICLGTAGPAFADTDDSTGSGGSDEQSTGNSLGKHQKTASSGPASSIRNHASVKARPVAEPSPDASQSEMVMSKVQHDVDERNQASNTAQNILQHSSENRCRNCGK